VAPYPTCPAHRHTTPLLPRRVCILARLLLPASARILRHSLTVGATRGTAGTACYANTARALLRTRSGLAGYLSTRYTPTCHFVPYRHDPRGCAGRLPRRKHTYFAFHCAGRDAHRLPSAPPRCLPASPPLARRAGDGLLRAPLRARTPTTPIARRLPHYYHACTTGCGCHYTCVHCANVRTRCGRRRRTQRHAAPLSAMDAIHLTDRTRRSTQRYARWRCRARRWRAERKHAACCP